MPDVTFFFDPRCPWTWRASRWLVGVAPTRDLTVAWRAFSLTVLREREGDATPAEVTPPVTEVLRMVEALAADGRHDDAGRLYTVLGTLVHEDGIPLTSELVADAAARAGVADRLDAASEASWDAAIGAALDRALALAGPYVGSPVIELPDAPRGLHGPILTTVPDGDAGVAIWDSVVTLARQPEFCEVKRSRR
jgi:hypothetical protein